MMSSNVLAVMLVLVAAVSAFQNVANFGLKTSAIKASYFDNMAAGSWGVPSTSAPAAPAPSAPVSTPSFSASGSSDDFYGSFGKGGSQMTAPLISGKTVAGTSQGYFDDLVGKEIAFSAPAAAAPAASSWGAAPAAAAPAPVSTPSFSSASGSDDFYGNFGKGGSQMTAPLVSGKTVGGTSQGYFDGLVGQQVAFSAPAAAAPAASSWGAAPAAAAPAASSSWGAAPTGLY